MSDGPDDGDGLSRLCSKRGSDGPHIQQTSYVLAADTLLVIVGEYGVEDGTEDPARLAEYGEKSGRMNLTKAVCEAAGPRATMHA